MARMLRDGVRSDGNSRRVPSVWVFATLVLATNSKNDVLQPNYNDRIQQALETLCPGVDICNPGAYQPNILPNEVIDSDRNGISCCQGCSFHPDCQYNLNCCFQGNNTSDDAVDTTMECLYMQSNIPKESFASPAPAYHTVSMSPKDGCKLTSAPRTLGGFNATCDAVPITPWGDLFPVYSIEKDRIYKNELCALCHGVVNVIPWQPVLMCDKINREDRRTLTLSEQLQFLEYGSQSANCYVEFKYEDKTIMFGKQCYDNQISTCRSVTQERFSSIPDDLQLTSTDIAEACETGAHSIVNVHGVVYRNIFCAICSVPNLVHPLVCDYGDARTVGELTLFLMLDVDFYRKDYGVQTAARNQPQYCNPNGATLGIDSCRAKKCPSGQLQNKDGTCQYPSKEWGFDSYTVFVKLTSTGVSSNFTGQFQQQFFNAPSIKSILSNTAPWPKNWRILTTFQSFDGNEMGVTLISLIDDPGQLTQDIRQSISKPWPVVINDTNVTFEQHFFEYRLTLSRSGFYEPQWKIMAEKEGLPITGMVSQQWFKINWGSLVHISCMLTKLYVCDQIVLRPGEYNLLLENMVLKSNLTRRILFDLEFELVDDGTGSLTARVCLSDTLLQTRSVTISVYVQLEMLCVCIVICVCNSLRCN